jgi:D-alanine transfer protein
MRKFFILYLFPFVLALILIHFLALSNKTNDFLFSKQEIKIQLPSISNYISELDGNSFYENNFLLNVAGKNETIFILGSSELTAQSGAIPYNFLPLHYNINIKAIGKAGNQCFSIYCQLLANEDRLNNTKIIFIISPGWFESKASRGTSSEIFLKYNSENFLKNIANKDGEFQNYAGKRISQLYSEFNSPNLPLKILNFKYRASKSLLHKAVFEPLIYIDRYLLNKKEGVTYSVGTTPALLSYSDTNQRNKKTIINWDSLIHISRLQVINNATNNKLGINNAYYTEHIKRNYGTMQPVNERYNQEFEDFKMLMKLIRAKKIDAFFIIQPFNPLYYRNLNEINPILNKVRQEIKGNNSLKGYECADFFITDKSKYDSALLNDIMHFSNYGWYKANICIINHYKLNNENK